MAATLTDTGQLTYASFPIDKTETTPDGDLMVYGKASDGSIDADQQIVDPKWMAKAITEWFASGPNLRVQHNAQRDPAGVGMEWNTDAAGATWVKGLVGEPVAKKLVSMGALRAYSVGIARPTIERDVTGKARGGIITDGTLVEISLVDRPANKSCGIQLVKSASDGSPEFVEKVFGDENVIAKFTGVDMDMIRKGDFTIDTANMPAGYKAEDMSLTFTPNDLAKILKTKIIDQHYEDLARKAKDLGVTNPLSDTDNDKLDGTEDVTPKEAIPEVVKDPEETPEPAKKAKKPKAKKMPPWMSDDDGKGDASDNDADDKSATADACKLDHAHTEKCMPSGTPQSASGAIDAASMQEIPNTSNAPQSPMPAGRDTPDHGKASGMSPEAAAMLRFKSIGMDTDLGRLHDLTCPAFHPEDVTKYHPFASFESLIDEDLWMRKAVDAACGPLGNAFAMTQVWQAVQTLKGADAADLNDFRLEMHKAFRDANPGPTSYPSPGMMSPGKFKRPVVSEGHAANSPGYGPPNSSATIPDTAPNAHSFGRPPLGAGHQSPSPSFMKGNDGEYPSEQGVPTSLTYAHMEKDNARRALVMMHDHLQHQFPQGCPMIEQDAYRVDSRPPVPPIAGKAAEDAKPEEVTLKEMNAALSGDFSDDLIEKGMRKKLAKKVLSGKLTIDEARSKLGRARAQKSQDYLIDAVEKGIMTIDEARAKMGLKPWNVPETQAPLSKGALSKGAEPVAVKGEIGMLEISNAVDPEIIKTAIAEAIAPLVDKIEKQDKTIGEQEARWEAAANLPDPKTASWAGLALNKNARPAGVTTIAENAERTQVAHLRQAHRVWRTSENPFEREAARAELDKYGFTE